MNWCHFNFRIIIILTARSHALLYQRKYSVKFFFFLFSFVCYRSNDYYIDFVLHTTNGKWLQIPKLAHNSWWWQLWRGSISSAFFFRKEKTNKRKSCFESWRIIIIIIVVIRNQFRIVYVPLTFSFPCSFVSNVEYFSFSLKR